MNKCHMLSQCHSNYQRVKSIFISESTREKVLNQAQKNLFETCSIIMMMFVFSSLLEFVINILVVFVDPIKYAYLKYNWVNRCSRALVIVNNVVNPFAFILRYNAFKEKFFSIFKKGNK